MFFPGRNRIICFRIDIKNDFALLGAMRLEPLQRYYHACHSGAYMFASGYDAERLREHFSGQRCELVDVVIHKAEPYVAIKKTLGAFSDALGLKTGLRREFLRQEGSSGRLYRAFINNYFRLAPGERYLELGADDGTAFAAALHGNKLEALAVDDWREKEEARIFLSEICYVLMRLPRALECWIKPWAGFRLGRSGRARRFFAGAAGCRRPGCWSICLRRSRGVPRFWCLMHGTLRLAAGAG